MLFISGFLSAQIKTTLSSDGFGDRHEGKMVDLKTGDCVDKSKLDGSHPEDKVDLVTSTDKIGPGEDGPNDGITYRSCSGTYGIGCKDPVGGDTIKQLQKCLGVKDTGYFGKNTERAVESETNKKTINRQGIILICGNF
jgi:hypothetical protein